MAGSVSRISAARANSDAASSADRAGHAADAGAGPFPGVLADAAGRAGARGDGDAASAGASSARPESGGKNATRSTAPGAHGAAASGSSGAASDAQPASSRAAATAAAGHGGGLKHGARGASATDLPVDPVDPVGPEVNSGTGAQSIVPGADGGKAIRVGKDSKDSKDVKDKGSRHAARDGTAGARLAVTATGAAAVAAGSAPAAIAAAAAGGPAGLAGSRPGGTPRGDSRPLQHGVQGAATVAMTQAEVSGGAAPGQRGTGTQSASPAGGLATPLAAGLAGLMDGKGEPHAAGSPAARRSDDAAGASRLAASGLGAGAAAPDLVRGLMADASQLAPAQRSVSVPVGHEGWSQALGMQVQWLTGQGLQAATLQLSPPQLGPIHVHLDVQNTQVNVTFTAAHPDTRSALEQAVPTLRTLLAGGGLTLGQAHVQQQPGHSGSQPGPGSRPAAVRPVGAVPASGGPEPPRLGLIDEYA